MSETGLGTTAVVQVAIVVKDIEAKSAAWAAVLGVPKPNVIITDGQDLAHTRYKGIPTDARAKLAFINLGQVALELIEPIGEPSTWAEELQKNGEGMHHIAFNIKGMEDKTAYLESNGVPLVQTGDYTGGRYAYFDGVEKLGLVIELLEND